MIVEFNLFLWRILVCERRKGLVTVYNNNFKICKHKCKYSCLFFNIIMDLVPNNMPLLCWKYVSIKDISRGKHYLTVSEHFSVYEKIYRSNNTRRYFTKGHYNLSLYGSFICEFMYSVKSMYKTFCKTNISRVKFKTKKNIQIQN